MVERNSVVPSIDDHGFSDRVCDGTNEKRLLLRMSCVFIAVCFGDTALGSTTTAHIKSKRIAIADSTSIFATDVVGTEAIAESSS